MKLTVALARGPVVAPDVAVVPVVVSGTGVKGRPGVAIGSVGAWRHDTFHIASAPSVSTPNTITITLEDRSLFFIGVCNLAITKQQVTLDELS